ncbi:DUF998 domain-containing protein [Caproiciproducens sp. CPB-2]|uniref:DUF998 domain-containing protein n=1 Tax=Caproiciproducens sp. CPB-2 TaxID=3030017 RepID=UPI0023DC3DE9|nr:DUF998 domain-containing protein [Caproiciproducens sp. CPB-2]MDF1495342.1 DUF998 domain-containing protein [Caproiciproducens sp. CPB-2]
MNHTTNDHAQGEKRQVLTKLQTDLITMGIVSSILYLITVTTASAVWSDYSPVSQTVSELIAIDAPTRLYVAMLFVVYDLLIYAYGIGIMLSSNGKRTLKIAALLIIAKEALGLAATLFFPIHLRGVEADFSDTMHGILTAAGVFLCMFPAMIAGAVSFKGKFRAYSIITMILFVIFGILAGLDQPKYALNMPTPMMGVWERINIYGYMLWIVVFSILLLRLNRGNESEKRITENM